MGKPLKTFCPICPPACFPASMALPALASTACGTERTEVAGVCSAWCNTRVLSEGLSGCLEELGGAGVVEKHPDVPLALRRRACEWASPLKGAWLSAMPVPLSAVRWCLWSRPWDKLGRCAPAIKKDKFQLQSILELFHRAGVFPPF